MLAKQSRRGESLFAPKAAHEVLKQPQTSKPKEILSDRRKSQIDGDLCIEFFAFSKKSGLGHSERFCGLGKKQGKTRKALPDDHILRLASSLVSQSGSISGTEDKSRSV